MISLPVNFFLTIKHLKYSKMSGDFTMAALWQHEIFFPFLQVRNLTCYYASHRKDFPKKIFLASRKLNDVLHYSGKIWLLKAITNSFMYLFAVLEVKEIFSENHFSSLRKEWRCLDCWKNNFVTFVSYFHQQHTTLIQTLTHIEMSRQILVKMLAVSFFFVKDEVC